MENRYLLKGYDGGDRGAGGQIPSARRSKSARRPVEGNPKFALCDSRAGRQQLPAGGRMLAEGIS